MYRNHRHTHTKKYYVPVVGYSYISQSSVKDLSSSLSISQVYLRKPYECAVEPGNTSLGIQANSNFMCKVGEFHLSNNAGKLRGTRRQLEREGEGK